MALGLIIRDGTNTARTISELVIRDGTNTARTISELWIRDTNNVPRLVFNPSGSASLSVVAAPGSLSGFSFGTGTATTDLPCVATASNGTPPYTYAWNLVSYTLVDTPPDANSPTAASSTFTQTGISPGNTESAEWTCTVTDDDGNTAVSNQITTYFSDVL